VVPPPVGPSFQSPLHRGTLFNALRTIKVRPSAFSFSPLFIGALSSTLQGIDPDAAGLSFSPLFIGALSSTPDGPMARSSKFCVSVPSSSGHSLQLLRLFWPRLSGIAFQSPLHRGTLFNAPVKDQAPAYDLFQSPLHRGTLFNNLKFLIWNLPMRFQSPLHRGTLFNCTHTALGVNAAGFSPLFIGALSSTWIPVYRGLFQH